MKIRKLSICISLAFCYVSGSLAHSQEIATSSKNEIFDNPFIALGFNPSDKNLTGYVSALHIAPGETHACQFVFSGKAEKANNVSVQVKGVGNASSQSATAEIRKQGNVITLLLPSKAIPGDCDWILPMSNEDKVSKTSNGIELKLETSKQGKWKGVAVVQAAKAWFYANDNQQSRGKAFVIAGDVIYIYDEKPDWYYVKFSSKKKETVGWIPKKDLMQF